jgi:hypothetical protein
MSTKKPPLYVSVDLLVTMQAQRPCLADGHESNCTYIVEKKGKNVGLYHTEISSS